MTITVAVLLIAATIPANLFPVIYHLRQPWYADSVGRHIMSLAVVVALLTDISTVALFWDYPAWLVAALYLWFNIVLWHGIYILIRQPNGVR